MRFRQVVILLFGLGVWLSACGPNRYELYQGLSEADRELFARSRQFMTDRQEERFLGAANSEARVALVESLHIIERLAKFPPHERQAIMAQRLVPGMSAEAVMLSWGPPKTIDRRNQDGREIACWFYERGGEDGRVRERRVYFEGGQVTEISP